MKRALEVAGGKHLVLESDVLVLLVTFDSGPIEMLLTTKFKPKLQPRELEGCSG